MNLTIIDQTGDAMGGAQQSLELFIRHCPPDIRPIVICFEDGLFANRVRKLGIKTVVVPIAGQLRSFTRERTPIRNLVSLPTSLLALTEAVRETAPDVVYTNGVKAHIFGSVAARAIGVACVVHHRDLLTGVARLVFLVAIAICSRARIATSLNVARAFPLSRTFVIENAVELAHFQQLPDRSSARAALGFAGSTPIAAIVGRINRWKGIDRFMRALALVNQRIELDGVVVGAPHFRDADLVQELHVLRTALGLENRLHFVDWMEDTRSLYAAIDINVNASDREPFGRTVIEAAAAGRPSVCFDDSGVSETMLDGTTGLVVPAADEVALGAALETYAGNAALRERAGIAARAWSERFDAGTHAERVAAVLRAAVESRTAKP